MHKLHTLQLAGTMGHEPAPGQLDPKKGTLYTFDPKGTVKKHFDGIDIANGLAWTADDKTMYYIDSFSYRWVEEFEILCYDECPVFILYVGFCSVDAFDYDAEAGTIREYLKKLDVAFKVTEVH